MGIVIFNFPSVQEWENSKVIRNLIVSYPVKLGLVYTVCSEVISVAFTVIVLSYKLLKFSGSFRASERVLCCLAVFTWCSQEQNVLFFIYKYCI